LLEFLGVASWVSRKDDLPWRCNCDHGLPPGDEETLSLPCLQRSGPYVDNQIAADTFFPSDALDVPAPPSHPSVRIATRRLNKLDGPTIFRVEV
jgi:hypothetical protein